MATKRKTIAKKTAVKSRSKTRATPVRRIITGHDKRGRSIIIADKASPHVLTMQGVLNVTDVWKTRSSPADNADPKDPCSTPITLAPPAMGSVVRIVEFLPDKTWMKSSAAKDTFAALGSSGKAALAKDSSRHPMMHRTRSIDYALIMSGEIWAIMDVGETKMKAGDILVQRGTNHAWANRSSKPCCVAFVLIDAAPLPEQAEH